MEMANLSDACLWAKPLLRPVRGKEATIKQLRMAVQKLVQVKLRFGAMTRSGGFQIGTNIAQFEECLHLFAHLLRHQQQPAHL